MTEIIIAIISGILILYGTYYTVSRQLKNERENRKLEQAEAEQKEKLGMAKLKRDIERELWQDLQAELKKETKKRQMLESRVDELEAERDEKDVIIAALTRRVDELEAEVRKERGLRVKVERENTRLKQENRRLKEGGKKI